jgi:hypothetical protein
VCKIVGLIPGQVEQKTSSQQEEFEDTKGVIKICKLKKDRQHNGQKDKQLSTI